MNGKNKKCVQNSCNQIHNANPISYVSVQKYSDQALMKALINQPVAVSLCADSNDFQFVSITITTITIIIVTIVITFICNYIIIC